MMVKLKTIAIWVLVGSNVFLGGVALVSLLLGRAYIGRPLPAIALQPGAYVAERDLIVDGTGRWFQAPQPDAEIFIHQPFDSEFRSIHFSPPAQKLGMTSQDIAQLTDMAVSLAEKYQLDEFSGRYLLVILPDRRTLVWHFDPGLG